MHHLSTSIHPPLSIYIYRNNDKASHACLIYL
ncbi:hypothetical protein CSUI_006881, partial [Cystoisospora suis]